MALSTNQNKAKQNTEMAKQMSFQERRLDTGNAPDTKVEA